MKEWMVLIFTGATNIVLVESICFHIKPRKEYDTLCRHWWDIAFNYKENSDTDYRQRCVILIHDKCPKMMDIESTMTRKYDENRINNEMWILKVNASLKSEPGTWMAYYTIENNPVCSDNYGKEPDCNYWWTVVKDGRVGSKLKQLCVNRILHHCSNMISLVKKTKTKDLENCPGRYDLTTYTYRKEDGDEASYLLCQRGMK